MSLRKNLNLLKIVIFKSKWRFTIPKQKEVLIYDHGAEYLFNFLNKQKCFIYHARGESINFYILIKTLIKFGFKNLKINYKKTYFELVNPKFIITFRHQNRAFYKLKNIFKKAVTIFIQWGKAQEFMFKPEETHSKNSYHVDYMFTFGDDTSRKYSNMINGKTFSIGSIQNNNIYTGQNIEKNSLVFISQYKSFGSLPLTPYKNFPKFEKIILWYLKKYCSKKNIKLYVCSRNLKSDKQSYDAYSKVLGKDGWHYCAREHLGQESDFNTYERVMNSEFVVFIDSTLGYEALSRNKKVAAFSFGARSPELWNANGSKNIISTNQWYPTPFGYPTNLPDKGPFWTNIFKKKYIIEILDYITNVSDEEWLNILKKYKIENIIKFDKGNSKLINLLKELKIPLKELESENKH